MKQCSILTMSISRCIMVSSQRSLHAGESQNRTLEAHGEQDFLQLSRTWAFAARAQAPALQMHSYVVQ